MPALTNEQLTTPATQASWLSTIFSAAVLLGLPTTSWRAGDPERVMMTMLSYLGQRFDALASAYNQGGFLDFAATGTVLLEVPDGQSLTIPVSPDPSDLSVNPTGATTLLDQLATQNYNVERIRLTFAGGAQAYLNTSVSTYGPFAAGTFHVSNPTTAATYSNTASLTIPPSALAGTSITTVATSGGLIKITTAANHGLSTGAAVYIVGVEGTTEANGAWYITVVDADEFTLDGSAFVSAYVPSANDFAYVPTTGAVTADVAGSASSSYDASGVLALHTVTDTVTSLLGVSTDNLAAFVGSDTENNVAYVARTKLKLQSVSVKGPKGAYEFYALTAQIYAPLLATPQKVSAPITRVFANPDPVSGFVYTFIANANGAPSTPDLLAVDAVIQAYVVPLGVTAITISATNLNVAAVLSLWLPAIYNTAENVAYFQTAIQDYFEVLPIGGLTDPNGSYTNIVPVVDVMGAVYEAASRRGITIDNAGLTLNGGGNVTLVVTTTSAEVAKLVPAIPTVTLNST